MVFRQDREAPLPQAATSEGITSTTFEIARNSTVQTDNAEHKVSICQIDLKPTFEYTSVPKLVAHAFLKAKVTNDSNYALLAGPANVFLDNNFLTKVIFYRSFLLGEPRKCPFFKNS